MWHTTAIAVLAATSSACAVAGREAAVCASGEGPLQAAIAGLIAADNAADLKRVLGQYTEAVLWLPPFGDALVGKAAIRPRYEQLFRDFRPVIRLDIYETIDAGTLGIVRGRTHGQLLPTGSGDPVDLDDNFLAVLQCEESQWRVSHLAWSPRDGDR